MNWIDDKYKEKLGDKKFPENLKKAGWERAQVLLDKEMPNKGGLISKKLGLSLLIGLAVISIPLFWWNSTQQDTVPAESVPVIENQNFEKNNVTNENYKEESKTLNGNFKEAELEVSNEVIESSSASENSIMSSQVELNQNAPVAKEEGVNSLSTVAIEESENESELNQNTDLELERPILGENSESFLGDKTIEGEERRESGDESPASVKEDEQAQSSENVDDLMGKATDPDPKIENQDNDPSKGPETQGEPNGQNDPSESSDEPKNNGSGDEANGELEGLNGNDSLDNPKILLEDSGEGIDTYLNENEKGEEMDDISVPPISSIKNRKSHFAFIEKSDEDFLLGDKGYPLFSRERFSISFWGGYTYTDKFLSASNNSYLERRSNEEEAIYTTPTGFNIDYFVDKNWTFGTGISWSEYGENLDYDLSRIDTSIANGRGQLPSSFDDVIYIDSVRVIDSIFSGYWQYTFATRSNDSVAQANNGRTSWQYVEIPFTVGYRFGEGRVKPWIKTGVSIGVPIQTSFRYVNPQATELNDLGLKDQLVAPLQYNYLLSIGLDCYLSRSISMRLNAVSSFQLNSSLQQQAIRQRYYRLGVTLGLAYNF